MSWIEDSRREAFENSQRVRAGRRLGQVGNGGAVGDLERSLPDDVKKRAVTIGNELILSYEDALTAIAIASEHQIAVLGFDSGEVLGDGFQVLNYTAYDGGIPFAGDWKAYVAAMNVEADRWIKEYPLGRNHGYVIASTSEKEFADMKRLRQS
jgi:hypothetical protein